MDKTTPTVVSLFDELIACGEEIRRCCTQQYFSGKKRQLPVQLFGQWRTNCLSLLKSTFGSSSPQFDNFASAKFFDYYNSTQVYLGILKGARKDLSEGYFFHKDLMLSVNILDSLINRARVMVDTNRVERAAGVLDAVLQEILAKVCDNRKIPHDEAEGLEGLCGRLESAGGLSPEVQERLREVSEVFREGGGARNAPAVRRALEWTVSFLDKELGARILILN